MVTIRNSARRPARALRRAVLGAAVLLLAGCQVTGLPQKAQTASISGQEAQDRALYLSSIAGLLDTARPQAALAFLEDYQNRWPDDRRAFTLQGRALLATGEPRPAEEAFRRAIALEPTADAWVGLGHVAAAGGDWMVAQERFSRALELEPANARALNNYGYALLKLGLPDEAHRWLLRARELDPGNDRVAMNLMVAAWFSGRRETAESIMASLHLPDDRARAAALLTEWSQELGDDAGDSDTKERLPL